MSSYKYFLACAIIVCGVSCTEEEDNPVNPDQDGKSIMTDVSGSTVVNYGNIELGVGKGDIVFEMNSQVITPQGKHWEYTLNCCAMGAATLKDGVQDNTTPVTNVTMINKGTITVHTHDLVEKYVDQIQSPENPGLRYKYLRLIGLYAGKNSKVVNDGVINVYFDHDPLVTPTIYVMGLIAGEGSEIINNGEINFYGMGSINTRLRGIGTYSDNINIVNNGLITADVSLADDSRAITTGGTLTNVVNEGTIRLRLPCSVYSMTRYGDTHLTNNGTIEITSTNVPEGYQALANAQNCIQCALYEPLQAVRTGMPPMINNGKIFLKMDESGTPNPNRKLYGMLFDLQDAVAENLNVTIVNTGSIQLDTPPNSTYEMAEASFSARMNAMSGACNVTLGTWKTKLRDFRTTRDLFQARCVKMDFSQGTLLLDADDSYENGTSYSIAPEDLMINLGAKMNLRYEYSGYDQLMVKPANENYSLNWDKEARTASLTKKN